MLASFKKILNKAKGTSIKSGAITPMIEVSSVKFELKYKDLSIGFLVFESKESVWKFSYSNEFKNQDEFAPIVSFPNKNEVYEGKELWSFFASRIPDNASSSTKSHSKEFNTNVNLVDLLKSYGQKTITNPFDLSLT